MMSPAGLFESFESLVRRYPGRPVLRTGAGPTSAAALLDSALSAASSMRAEGLKPGELVLLAAAGRSFVEGVLAVWSCGSAALAADAQLGAAELDQLRRTFVPRLTLSAPEGRLQARREEGSQAARLPAETAVIKLSSGSTGKPRGVAVAADQLLADTRHLIEGMRIEPDDVNIGAIPLSHSYGMDSLLMPLVVQGSPILLVPAPLPELLAGALSIDEPAIFPGVPYLFDLLARRDILEIRRRGLKTCISAGALLRSSTAAIFREKLGLPIRSFYGTSETGGITYDASPEGDAAIRSEGCVGTPLPGVEVSLIREEDTEEERVVVRGPNVAAGYVGSTDESSDGAFGPGAFRTGDTGRVDEHGRLHLTGRIGGLVNVSGRKINPREIERSLSGLRGVSDVAVLGMSDHARGESLAAFLVADPEVTREKVQAHLRQRLAPYKHPRRIVFLKELPRNLRGKLDRERLREEGARGEGK